MADKSFIPTINAQIKPTNAQRIVKKLHKPNADLPQIVSKTKTLPNQLQCANQYKSNIKFGRGGTWSKTGKPLPIGRKWGILNNK